MLKIPANNNTKVHICSLNLTDSTLTVNYKKIDTFIKVVRLNKSAFRINSSSPKITKAHDDIFYYNVAYNISGLGTLYISMNNKKVFSKVF